MLWIYQPGCAVHLAHDAVRHESLLKARRAAHPSGQVDQCEKPSCAGENGSPLDRHCYSGQTHRTAAVWILAGPGFATERFTPVNWPLRMPANHMSF